MLKTNLAGESRDGAHARAAEVDDGVGGVVRCGDLIDAARSEGGIGEDEHARVDGVAARRRGIGRDAPPLQRRREVNRVVEEVVGDLKGDAAEPAGSDPRRGRGYVVDPFQARGLVGPGHGFTASRGVNAISVGERRGEIDYQSYTAVLIDSTTYPNRG